MENESIFKVGQRVWDCSYRWGEICKVDSESNRDYPVRVRFDNGSHVLFTCDGRYALDSSRTLFFEEITIPESALKPKRWRADKDEEYHFIVSMIEVFRETNQKSTIVAASTKDTYNQNHTLNYNSGNYFRTREEAEQAAEKVRQLLLSL